MPQVPFTHRSWLQQLAGADAQLPPAGMQPMSGMLTWAQRPLMHFTPWFTPQQSVSVMHFSSSPAHTGIIEVQASPPSPDGWQ